jgi:hypothetical protein
VLGNFVDTSKRKLSDARHLRPKENQSVASDARKPALRSDMRPDCRSTGNKAQFEVGLHIKKAKL